MRTKDLKALLASASYRAKHVHPAVLEDPFRTANRNRELAVLHALIHDTSFPELQALARSIIDCSDRQRCESAFCTTCKALRWRLERRRVRKWLLKRDADGLLWVTIIFGVANDGIPEAEEMISDGLRMIETRFRTVAQTYPAFAEVSWRGRVEVDLVQGPLGHKRTKQKTLKALGYDEEEPAYALVPHVHMLLDPNGRHPTSISHHLRKDFPASMQVKISRLRSDRSLKDNLDNLVGYPLKNELPRTTSIRSSKIKTGRLHALPVKDRKDQQALLAFYVRMIEGLGGLRGLHVRSPSSSVLMHGALTPVQSAQTAVIVQW